MRVSKTVGAPSITILTALTLLLTGCGLEFTPTREAMFYPKKLPAADRAVEEARTAGKAAQCPDAFQEAEKLRNEALAFYRSCNEAEALARADSAIARANALCPPRAQAPPPPPPPPVIPPPPPTPTATISANPASIQQGTCTTLSWSSTNASSATIDPSLGSVGLVGSQQACPPATTQYAIDATGAGGTARASTMVTVTAPPPPPPPPPAPAPKVIDRLTLHINFDFDKAYIRNADLPELQKALAFVHKYAGSKVSIEGHTDNIGSEKYNQGLSERRAAAVKSWLLAHGATGGAKMQTVGHGESKPIADNKTPQGRFENRRVEILIVSE